MSTNLEYREREGQRKREKVEDANEGTQFSVNYYFFGQISVNYYFFGQFSVNY